MLSDKSGEAAISFSLFLGYLIGGVQWECAFGAIFGSFFFLAMPSTVKGLRGFALWLASIGFGYMLGLAFFKATPYPGWAGFVALAGGALGAAVLTSVLKYINGGPLPDWISQLLDRVPWLSSKRSSTDV